jgi:hypothetical protein
MTKEEKLFSNAANINFAGGGIGCLFVLSYIIYYYGWTGTRQFTSVTGMILYYGLTALLQPAHLKASVP